MVSIAGYRGKLEKCRGLVTLSKRCFLPEVKFSICFFLVGVTKTFIISLSKKILLSPISMQRNLVNHLRSCVPFLFCPVQFIFPGVRSPLPASCQIIFIPRERLNAVAEVSCPLLPVLIEVLTGGETEEVALPVLGHRTIQPQVDTYPIVLWENFTSLVRRLSRL